VPVVFPSFLFSSIYSVFHSSLVDHLFAKQSSSLPRVDVSDIDMATLHGQLEEVERCAAINPIEEELHLGMRGIDIVRQAGGGRAKEAPAAGPTPKETLLGEARGEERERKTAGYEQPSAAGWKKEGREVGEEKIPSKGQLNEALSSALDAVARASSSSDSHVAHHCSSLSLLLFPCAQMSPHWRAVVRFALRPQRGARCWPPLARCPCTVSRAACPSCRRLMRRRAA